MYMQTASLRGQIWQLRCGAVSDRIPRLSEPLGWAGSVYMYIHVFRTPLYLVAQNLSLSLCVCIRTYIHRHIYPTPLHLAAQILPLSAPPYTHTHTHNTCMYVCI